MTTASLVLFDRKHGCVGQGVSASIIPASPFACGGWQGRRHRSSSHTQCFITTTIHPLSQAQLQPNMYATLSSHKQPPHGNLSLSLSSWRLQGQQQHREVKMQFALRRRLWQNQPGEL